MVAPRPPHPGTILKERFLDPLGISLYRLARSIGVPTRRVSELVRGRRRITPDTAIRLGLFFGVPPVWWLEMQARYDAEDVVLTDNLRARVKPYEGLEHLLVSPGGVRALEPTTEAPSRVVLVKVPAALESRLRAQAALAPPRSPRRVRTITYQNGAPARVGEDE